MSNSTLATRLARPVGAVWPNAEQDLVLQAIFAEEGQACTAFLTWRESVDLDGHFERAVFRLLPLLYLRMSAMGVDDPVMARLKGVYRNAWSDTHSLLYATAPAIAALEAAGIPTLLLKGAPLVLLHYRNHGSRPMADLDLAVPAAHVQAALTCLARAGWLPDVPITAHDLQFRHATTLRGGNKRELDLHWHLLFEHCDATADEVFWSHTVPLTCNGVSTAALRPELTLLHGVIHGLRANTEPPIRWIADALTVLNQAGENFDWTLLTNGASRLGMARRVWLGLRYLRQAHAASIPPSVLDSLRIAPSPLAERLEAAMMLRVTPLALPRSLQKFLLLIAEFLRVTQARSWLAGVTLLPAFLKYRLGLPSARGLSEHLVRL